ncbi:MAG TPA: leucyl aminopeptidase [Streptosporangiaceae bacterium]|nr:leucyl aminopeptidase [Streptosporangiaceae bacterium]
MPITTDVVALPGASARPLAAYVASLASGEADPAGMLCTPVQPDGPDGPRADPALDELLPVTAAEAIAAYRLSGKAGEAAQAMATIAGQPVTLLLLGVGDRSPRALRRAGAELGRRLADGGTATTSVVAAEDSAGVQAFAEGILLGGYGFKLSSGSARLGGATAPGSPPAGSPQAAPGLARLLVSPDADGPAALRRAAAIAGAVGVARDLANTPSAVKSPQWLADEAVRVTAGRGVQARVWAEDELAAAGFGGILAVGSGSVRPPRLIELSYRPDAAPEAAPHIVLVGKGITFDSGGLSLKPNDGMKAMKTDMSGGAVVIAVLSALAALGVPCRVTGLVAAAENMPSGSAYRPGDVITHYGGRTVEVLNTDAEGRLVLADALAYAVTSLRPDQLIDVATLTGAARVALGTTHAALYATDDELARSLTAAGEASGDRVWRMPLEDGYRKALDSEVADLAHVARDNTSAGSIVAALFLREFAGGRPWAHLDIAGPGRSADNNGELSKGATGFGVRLLLRHLSSSEPEGRRRRLD